MPVYEYHCADCRRTVSVFFRSFAAVSEPTCPRCGGRQLERRFSRVVVRRGSARAHASEAQDEAMGMGSDFGDGEFGSGGSDGFGDDFDMDNADPRELARWTRMMSESMGEPLDPELNSALTDIERGADPEEVISRFDASESPLGDDE